MASTSWFSEQGDEHVFQQHLERVTDWDRHLSAGTISNAEAQQQAERVVSLLQQVESRIDDETHALLTEALVEWAVLQGMQLLLAVADAA
jgi:hypothetical protein